MALVSIVIIGIHLFSDIGIHAALIQNEREDADFVNTMWTMEVIRGFALWLIALAIAGPVGTFYGEPILASLIPVAALTSVIDGFRSTNFKIANRNLQMRGIVTLELGSQVIGSVVMVVWASIVPTVWSLVAGGVVTAAISTIWSWWLPGPRNHFRLERRTLRTLYHFGRWIMLSTLFTFLAGNMDRMIFGKLVTMAVLGVYNIGLNLRSRTVCCDHVLRPRDHLSRVQPVPSEGQRDAADLPERAPRRISR